MKYVAKVGEVDYLHFKRNNPPDMFVEVRDTEDRGFIEVFKASDFAIRGRSVFDTYEIIGVTNIGPDIIIVRHNIKQVTFLKHLGRVVCVDKPGMLMFSNSDYFMILGGDVAHFSHGKNDDEVASVNVQDNCPEVSDFVMCYRDQFRGSWSFKPLYDYVLWLCHVMETDIFTYREIHFFSESMHKSNIIGFRKTIEAQRFFIKMYIDSKKEVVL